MLPTRSDTNSLRFCHSTKTSAQRYTDLPGEAVAEYRLHCFGESGNCYKAAIMLELCGCDWEPQFVDYLGGASRSEEYRTALNETGEIPVLEHDGRRLAQSGVIL